jgi:glutathione peroxidase
MADVDKASLFDVQIKDAKGELIDWKSFKDKAFVVANIATQCGFTPQLDGLEKIHNEFREKNVVVLGVPSNDFGGQNPEAENETVEFCKLNYGVTFPLTQKVSVKGKNRHQLFELIAKQRKGPFNVMWNFEKFIFNEKGQLVDAFRSTTKPDSDKVKKVIQSLL